MARVSVIIPNYNHAAYLRQRIDSVLAQTYQDFDLLILDDSSTDDSRSVIEAYRGRPRTTILFNERNSGSTFKQWNRGIANTAGELIWLAESDDHADPRLLERLVATLDAHPQVGLAYCASSIINSAGQVLKTSHTEFDELFTPPGRWHHDLLVSGCVECARYLVRYNTIPNASAVVFRRSLYDAVGGADETMRLSGDWMLWVNILLRSDLAYLAEPLNYFRTHERNVRSAIRGWQAKVEHLRIVRLIGSQLTIDPEQIASIRESAVDAMISGWLRQTLPDGELRRELNEQMRHVDPAYRSHIARRAASRAWAAARNGVAARWMGHLFKRASA